MLVYLVCGVAGAGKSWVCERLAHLAVYRPVDKVGHIDPTHAVEIHDRTVKVSTTIKRYEKMGIEVYPVFVMGDFLQVKQQLVDRGGKITKNLYRRWKRMEHLAEKHSKFTGSSSEVLRHLRSLLSHREVAHEIYRVTSPSGKVYIGKTSQGLAKRRYDHEWLAKKKPNTPFAKAILKYGDTMVWEVVESNIEGLERANQRERHWISTLDTTNPDKGYNLTVGGDGGKRSKEAEEKRAASLKRAYSKPELRAHMSTKAKAKWDDEAYHASTAEAIRLSRSSDTSRAKTKAQMEKQKQDPEWLAKMAEASKEAGSRPEVKAKLSSSGKRARAREFRVLKDGVEVARYLNQADAAVALGIAACSISQVLRGKAKRAGGYEFAYVDNPSPLNEEYLESLSEKARIYQNSRKQTDPIFKLMTNVRSAVYRALERKTSRTIDLLGCSAKELDEWLGPKPSTNHHLDHICPLSQARDYEEAKSLCHYTNLQWLSAEENLKKSDSWTPEGEEMCRKLLGRDWIF